MGPFNFLWKQEIIISMDCDEQKRDVEIKWLIERKKIKYNSK
jgi:hypothetical protein